MTAKADGPDPYSERVRYHFANPVHAGSLEESYPSAVVAEASESDSGARVVLSAVVEHGVIRRMRYRVLGCPHLIAAAESYCAEAEGQAVSVLRGIGVRRLMQSLAIPVEKTGRMFILEDAAKALHIALTAKQED